MATQRCQEEEFNTIGDKQFRWEDFDEEKIEVKRTMWTKDFYLDLALISPVSTSISSEEFDYVEDAIDNDTKEKVVKQEITQNPDLHF